jgi:hypothetical protein
MINENLYIEAAEYEGYSLEHARKLLAEYLGSRGDAASIEGFISWLEQH